MKKTFIKNIVATVVFVALVGFSYGQTNQVQEKEKNESSNEECSPCEEARKNNGGEKAVEYLVPVNISPAEKDKRQINYDGVIQNSKSIDITEEERILQGQIRNREKRYEEDAKQKAEALKSEQTKQEERNVHLQPSKLNAPKWEKGGIFEGYTPEQENISLRTQNSKKFINPDGSITAQIGGNYHYKDQGGNWKDIDFTIVPTNVNGFAYQNTTNTIKSYFPDVAGQKGVQLKNEKFDFSFWKNPELLVVDAAKNTVYQENRIGNLLSVTGETAHYQSFNNVVDEFKIIDYGIENNIIINQFNANWEVNGAKTVSFKQFIELPFGTKIIDINGTQKTTDFSSELVVLEFPSGEKVFFNPLITFDNNANKEEAKLFYGIEENKVPEDIKAKTASFYKGNYRVAFAEGGIEIYADVDLNWLKNAQFPVVVDPTVTVGSTVSGSFYGPMTHWYGFQRHATLYLQSEIGGYGTITQIDYYKTNTATARTKPTWVYMRNNSGTTLTSTANWNSATYISGATTCMNNVNTTQDGTAGWKALPLTTSHNYSTGNLQIMVKDFYGGYGFSQYMAQQTLASRQTYRRADNTDPGDGSAMTAESNFATVRITYSTHSHCAVTSTNTTYGISNFSTTGGQTNINNTTGAGTYTDYSSQVVTYNGTAINFSVSPVSGTMGVGLWIDWNNDGEFDGPNEHIFNSASYVSSATGTITVPNGIPVGDYRMRVVGNWLSQNPTPCGDLGSQNYGEAEDYTFKVLVSGPPNAACNQTIDHQGANWTISSATTVSGKHINVGNFTVNSGVTATVETGCPFEVEAINIDVRGTINGDGKGHAGGSGGAGGSTYGSCSDDEKKTYSGGKGSAGQAGSGSGGGNAGGNGGNATGTSRKCGGWFCSGNADGHFGGGGGAGGGGGGAYGGSGGSAPYGASGGSFDPTDNSSGTFGASGSAKTAVGTQSGTDLVMGSGGSGGGGGGGSTGYAGTAGGAGGRGGGMISLKACNNLSMTGVITANGSNGANGGNGGKNGSGNYNQTVSTCGNCGVCGEGTFYAHGGAGGGAGGGSGGGILLAAYGNSTITGILRANGGRGGNAGSPKTSESDFGIDYANGGGGGSGGRIKVFRNPCATNNINPSSISTNGGQGGLNGNNSNGSSGNSGTTSTAINHPDYFPLLAGSIVSSNITICSNTTPTATINANVSTGGAKNATLSCASGLPDYEYQWYVTKTACSTPTTGTGSSANTGWVAVSGATGQNMTASQVLAGINQVGSISEPNMYCFQRRTKSGNCYAWTDINSITVNPSPTPTFVSVFPSNNICVGTNITYTTQSGMSDYTWSIPGNAGVDYTIVSGGTSTDDNIVIAWNNASANTVIDVSYEQNGCAAVSPTSSTPITLPNTGNQLAGNESATCYVNGNNPIHFYNQSAPYNYIGSINPQGREGVVTMTSYLNGGGVMDACDMPGNPNYQTAYMERSFTVNGTITGGSNLSVYFPFTDAELNALVSLSASGTPVNSNDDVLTINDLVMTQYSGGSVENGTPFDNCIDGSSAVIPLTGRGDLNTAFTLSPNITAKYGRVDIASFSEFYFHGLNANSPLPVELSHFSASCDEHVEILWVTESELNADKFIVEKSRNGVNWELVDELVAAGNSNSHLSYSTTDKKPYQGVSYYRLRQVDFDGKEKIYGPISVSCTDNGNSINVYPNPNNGNFTVEINSPSDIEEASLQLLDVTGKLIASREFQIVDGVTQIMIEETQSLKPGTYVLKVIADVYFEPVKIVVK